MNTVDDLRGEFDRLAGAAPTDADVRRSLDARVGHHARRRRTASLIAVAAAVVLVAGGAGITGAVLAHRSVGPASPGPVVTVPDVPLPPDTQLIRHRLQAVTTPVTATPPSGLTGQVWMQSPGRLAVSWFDPSRSTSSMTAPDSTSYGPGDSPSVDNLPRAAGYLVTDSRDEVLSSSGPPGTPAPTVTYATVEIAGHAATLATAPANTSDEFGYPASERLIWKLADDRWIHVWVTGLPTRDSSPSTALRDFAAGITESPQTLNRTVGIGLTLPGLTVDSSMNSSPVAGYVGASLSLCPAQVDPFAPQSGSASGSGSASADGTASSQQTVTNSDPAAACISAAVLPVPPDLIDSRPATTVTVGDTLAYVDADQARARADLGHGLTAVVSAPPSARLSAADLAALVASVRLSPAVSVLPLPSFTAAASASGAATSALASPMPSPSTVATSAVAPASSAAIVPAPPPGASITAGPGASVTAGTDASSSPATTDPTAAARDAELSAHQRLVVMSYLQAVQAGDCAAAARYFAGQAGSGDLCAMPGLRLLAYSVDRQVETSSPDEAEFAATITVAGGDVSMPDGTMAWFLMLNAAGGGTWRITSGGTGP